MVLLIFGAVHVAQALTRLGKIRVPGDRQRCACETGDGGADSRTPTLVDHSGVAGRYAQPTRTSAEHLRCDPSPTIRKFDEPALLGAIETHARISVRLGVATNADRRERLIEAV
ncbi:MAG: hypothetical protein R2845_15770 [Thermomicrobiales bacterium]